MSKKLGWCVNEVIAVGVANPPAVRIYEVGEDVEDAVVQAFIEAMEARDSLAYVEHRGKKTPTRALAALLGRRYDHRRRDGSVKRRRADGRDRKDI